MELPNGLGTLHQQKINEVVYCTLEPSNLIYQINAGASLGKLTLPTNAYIAFDIVSSTGDRYPCSTDGYGNMTVGSKTIPANVWYTINFAYVIK